MFSFFKRKEWPIESISELSGSYNGLHVSLRNFSCQREPNSGARRFAYQDFGFEFITELSERQLGNYSDVAQTLNSGGSIVVPVALRGLPPIEVTIQGHADKKRAFYSDIADALLSAFGSKDIKP
jgi:hypothetical protein